MPVFTTAKGNYRYADLYHNGKTESFLDSHANFFEEVGGVHKEIVYDNTRVAVAKFIGLTEKEPTEELLKLSIYYGFAFRFCNICKANENALIESFFKTLKAEEVYLWEYETYNDAIERIPYFIDDVYNTKRLHSSLGYLPPEEFEDIFIKNKSCELIVT